MHLRVRLGCSACNHFEDRNITLPFDCNNEECSKCGESHCISIVSVNDNQKISELETERYGNLDKLCKIRQL